MRILLKPSSMAHFFFMHFPHPFPIGPPWGKLNFASETEEKKRLTNSIFRFPERTRNNSKMNVYGK